MAYSPGFHVLSKGPTSGLHIAWDCRNTGPSSGDALLRLFNLDVPARGVIAASPIRTISPGGASFILQIDTSSLNPLNFIVGQNDMELELTSISESPQAKAIHRFIINWSTGGGGGGAVISPVGEPSIG